MCLGLLLALLRLRLGLQGSRAVWLLQSLLLL
jgi:hypothetical protein